MKRPSRIDDDSGFVRDCQTEWCGDRVGVDKDLEMLGEMPSATSTDSIHERIARLKREIGRGESVYSCSEIQLLQRKLEDYESLLYALLHG